jgi:hypothetical protein
LESDNQVTVYSNDYERFKNRIDTKVTKKLGEKWGERLGENQKKIIELIQNNSFKGGHWKVL